MALSHSRGPVSIAEGSATIALSGTTIPGKAATAHSIINEKILPASATPSPFTATMMLLMAAPARNIKCNRLPGLRRLDRINMLISNTLNINIFIPAC
ncbi:hypothetical protein DSECCO2_577420 [anaerobic digester metagenome]